MFFALQQFFCLTEWTCVKSVMVMLLYAIWVGHLNSYWSLSFTLPVVFIVIMVLLILIDHFRIMANFF